MPPKYVPGAETCYNAAYMSRTQDLIMEVVAYLHTQLSRHFLRNFRDKTKYV